MKKISLFWIVAMGSVVVLLGIIFFLYSAGTKQSSQANPQYVQENDTSGQSAENKQKAADTVKSGYYVAGTEYFNITLPESFYAKQRGSSKALGVYLLANSPELQPYNLKLFILVEKTPEEGMVDYQLNYYRDMKYSESSIRILGSKGFLFTTETVSPNQNNEFVPSRTTAVVFSRSGQLWHINYSYIANEPIDAIESEAWAIINSIEFKI